MLSASNILTNRRRAITDLCIAFAIAIALLVLNIAINFKTCIHDYLSTRMDLGLTMIFVNALFVWLGFLFVFAFVRWRKANREREELEHVISSISPDTLLVVSPEDKIVYTNLSVNRMFEYEPEEILGLTTNGLFIDHRPGATQSEEGLLVAQHDEFSLGNAEGLRKNGSRFPLEIISSNLGPKLGTVLLLRDVSERERMVGRQREAEALIRARQAEQSLGTLTKGIAHEFNNLLMAIMGNLEMCLEDAKGAKADARITEAVTAVKRASGLCNEMLAYSGQTRLQFHDVRMDMLVDSLRKLATATAPDNIQCDFISTAEGTTFKGDFETIENVLANIFTNALEAIDEKQGHITIQTGVQHCSRDQLDSACHQNQLKDGHYAYIAVSDDGGGMPPDIRTKIFEPFFSTKFAGRGLGLSSAHGVMRQHHGGIRVESEVGAGTRITLLFPRTKPEDHSA